MKGEVLFDDTSEVSSVTWRVEGRQDGDVNIMLSTKYNVYMDAWCVLSMGQ